MKLRSDSFRQGKRIPAEFAFGRPGDAGEPCVLAANRSPHLAWDEVPEGTRSFALWCVDPDVPSRGDDVNQAGRTVPAELPRIDFTHWLIADMPAATRELAAGACSDGVTARGKTSPPGPAGSVHGRNDYTGWFAGDEAMAGTYLGYDGPCPPFNDSLPHRYFFRIYALDVERLGLEEGFDAGALQRAMQGHVLGEAAIFGQYSLNPALSRAGDG
ncbi:YbhB/YbcL family Raf kinase inhibitor-like protein [Pseudomarimonas salicorniae]|uniref:YbhB/YbcL family Raf kinase inhibitor-like protein n=1 Tax=Pseudomarimonas salicorniae TaxID=2933270 RepID=A0ABT0GCJ4_9GAMM|nr:YbhB/YbcL family Raf kinase inhibitor-like protein [Lysobacter sp. CAU 1642]MCK7592246.1 YbhB/YbcL family Raf kinase inhibitor-like protein [Lysobacter sp. CAU 1642]